MSSVANEPLTVIEARPVTLWGHLRALWRYRGLYGFLFREMMIRKARGTSLGLWWIVIRAVTPVFGYMYAFAVVAPLETGHELPYAVFFLSGFIPWRLFQSTLTMLPRNVMSVRGIMQRTYFPRLLVPLASFGSSLIEMGLLMATYLIVVASFALRERTQVDLGWHTMWLLPCLAGSLLFAMALGMITAIVAFFFRDVLFTVRYLSTFLMFVTPVLYPVTAIESSHRWVAYAFNPMAQMVTVSRYALTGQGEFEAGWLALAFLMIGVMSYAGMVFFIRAEAYLGDQL